MSQMHELATASTVAHVIQLAVAPVFLLTSIAGLLSVLVSRLGRVIDRARLLEIRLAEATEAEAKLIHDELATLDRRSVLVSRAIALSTATALMICATIATLFLGGSLGFETGWTVSVLFVLAMLSMVAALLHFLREVMIAAATVRFGARR